MATLLTIANIALQKLGTKRLASLTEGGAIAQAVIDSLENVVRAELQSHPWNCATKRALLPMNAVPPVYGRKNSYPLPADYLRLLPPEEGYAYFYEDRMVEGRELVTEYSGPLEIRYTAHITDVNLYPPLLIESIACRLALQLCEVITQSNTKKEGIRADQTAAIREARRQNALATRPHFPAMDGWEAVRYS